MKKILSFLLWNCMVATFIFPNTVGNIIEQRGQILVIDKGRLDGVQVGFKGIIKAVYKDPSGEYDVNIGLFSVRKVNDRTSEVVIESIGSGFKIEDARYVVFEDALKPPVSDTRTTDTAAPKSTKVSVEELLEQGEKLLVADKFNQALETFQRVLQIDSDNLIAKEKIGETQKKMEEADRETKFRDYLRKVDSYYQKKDVKYSFLYLAEAYKVFPEGRDEVKKRLAAMEKDFPQDFVRLVQEKGQDIGEMRALIGDIQESGETKVPTRSSEEFAGPEEPFLKEVRSKAISLAKNDRGYWEAVFSADLVMVYIPEGDFTLGSPEGDGDADEHPAHKAYISGYWMAKYEITVDQYDQYCRDTKAELALDEGWGRGKQPVINVSWEDAQKFCSWLSKRTGLHFRLPSEAEWEKAASDYYPWGSARPGKNFCNFGKIFGRTTPVGSFPAGASKYGIMDLAGNVWEWIHDYYDLNYYSNSSNRNPKGPESGVEKVVRGGSWDDGDYIIRSANRSSENQTSKMNKIGFRVVLITM